MAHIAQIILKVDTLNVTIQHVIGLTGTQRVKCAENLMVFFIDPYLSTIHLKPSKKFVFLYIIVIVSNTL